MDWRKVLAKRNTISPYDQAAEQFNSYLKETHEGKLTVKKALEKDEIFEIFSVWTALIAEAKEQSKKDEV